MIRKTTLLTGIAATLLMSAPAFAQDAMSPAPQEPATQTPPAATPAQSGAIQLSPGASVKGSDGSTLGTLEGVQNNAAGEQELTVRGTDGQLRGVPLGGLTQQGADVVVAWTSAEYTAAPAIADAASPAPSATPPASPDQMAAPPASDDAMTPPTPTDPATAPDGSTPPTSEPQS